jgi:hypothetical protein
MLGPLLGCLITAVVLALPLYVLSAGPAVWLFSHGYVGEWIGVFYLPIEYVHATFQPIRAPLDWYIELWRK